MAQQQQQMMQPRGMMMPMYPGPMIPMSTGPMMMMPGHAATMPIMPSQQPKSSSMQRVHKKVVTEEVVQKSKKLASYSSMKLNTGTQDFRIWLTIASFVVGREP